MNKILKINALELINAMEFHKNSLKSDNNGKYSINNGKLFLYTNNIESGVYSFTKTGYLKSKIKVDLLDLMEEELNFVNDSKIHSDYKETIFMIDIELCDMLKLYVGEYVVFVVDESRVYVKGKLFLVEMEVDNSKSTKTDLLLNELLKISKCKSDYFCIEKNVLEYLFKSRNFESRDDLRPVMKHVFVSQKDFDVEIVATDGHILTSDIFTANSFYTEKPGEELNFLIDTFLLSNIAILANEELAKITKIKEDYFLIETEKYEVFHRQQELKYVEYKNLFKDYKIESTIKVDKKVFLVILKKLNSVVDSTTKKLKITFSKIEGIEFKVDLSLDGPSMLKFKYKYFGLLFTNENFENFYFYINSFLMTKLINSLKNKELEISFIGKHKMIIVKNSNRDMNIIMPIFEDYKHDWT